MLSLHPDGMFGSVIAAYVHKYGVDRNVVLELLADMYRNHEITIKPRIYHEGEPRDSDSLYALPSQDVVRMAPNINPYNR